MAFKRGHAEKSAEKPAEERRLFATLSLTPVGGKAGGERREKGWREGERDEWVRGMRGERNIYGKESWVPVSYEILKSQHWASHSFYVSEF